MTILQSALAAILACGFAMADEPSTDTPPTAPADADKPASALDERAERIVKSMKSAQEKLAQKETGAVAQDLQKSILADLDELLKTPPQKSPNQNNDGGGGQSGGARGQSGQQSGTKSQGQPSAPTATGRERNQDSTQGAQRNRTAAEDSEERTGPAKAAENAAARRRRLEVEVWGHLPDKLREQLLNTYGEKMVPQYEGLVRKFYEALSEPPPSKR